MPLKNTWQNGEQFNASDANAVADAVNAAYVKDAGGIPKADLAAAVQVSLGKADTAVQAVSASSISDSTATGRSVLTAADAAAARTALGVAYGSTSGTVVQGNDSRLSPTAASITDSTATGRSVLTATDAAAARTALGVSYGSASGTVVQGNDSRVVGAEQSANKGQANGYAGLDSSGKVPASQLPTTGGMQRSVQTLTANATLGAVAGTDYVVFANIATVAASGDVNYHNTVALLTGDGTNNSTTITDSSYVAGAWTASGNAKLSTGTKKYGTASISFDGTNSFVASTNSTNFVLGTGSFTIEMWVYFTSTVNASIFDLRSSGSSTGLNLYTTNDGQLRGRVGSTEVLTSTGFAPLTGSSWLHLAVCKSGSSTRMFVNGSQYGPTYTDSNNYTASAGMRIGATWDGGNFLNGFVDDVRVLKSTALYTANFTPPAAAHATFYNPSVTPLLTLPTAVGNTNLYTVHNLNAQTLPLATASSQTINGSAPGSLTTGQKLTVISNGSNWVSPW